MIEPTWQSECGTVSLYLGDCLDVLPMLGVLPTKAADCVITDPPYNVDFVGKRTVHQPEATGGYIGGDSDVGPQAVRIALGICERGIVFPGNRQLFDYPKPYEVGCVYCPSGAGLGRWGFTVSHPVLFYGVGLRHSRLSPAGFSSFHTADDNGHPCPKPLEWMLWSIEKSTLTDETVLDPFMGSGTTGVAAVRLGRKFIGVEIEPKYFEIAKRRIIDALNSDPLIKEAERVERQRQMELVG